MTKITCETCEHLIKEHPFYWCGLERTENSDADVANWSDETPHPFDFQPDWCILKNNK